MLHRLLTLCIALIALPVAAQDVEKGKEINTTCAACHGEYGQGGKRGEYPRLAGQRAAYLEEQLRAYRSRKRINIPMFPYTQERELSDEDIRDVAAYLASIRLPAKYPDFKDTDDAYTRLLAMEKVMIIPRTEGSVDQGKEIYSQECAACHGPKGLGRAKIPAVVGQYTNYLRRQMDLYRHAHRPHDDEEPTKGVLNSLQEKDLQDVLAYLTTLQEVE